MKAAISASAVVFLASLVVPGCTAEMAPEDEALLAEEGNSGAQGSAGAESSFEENDEDVTESSQALCSCATEKLCANGQLTVYEHSDCCGASFHFCPGNYPDLRKYTNNLWWLANWNDRISRIRTSSSPKVGVWVYQHVNYGGDRRYFGPDSFVDLGSGLWNDKISSIKVVAIK